MVRDSADCIIWGPLYSCHDIIIIPINHCTMQIVITCVIITRQNSSLLDCVFEHASIHQICNPGGVGLQSEELKTIKLINNTWSNRSNKYTTLIRLDCLPKYAICGVTSINEKRQQLALFYFSFPVFFLNIFIQVSRYPFFTFRIITLSLFDVRRVVKI